MWRGCAVTACPLIVFVSYGPSKLFEEILSNKLFSVIIAQSKKNVVPLAMQSTKDDDNRNNIYRYSARHHAL